MEPVTAISVGITVAIISGAIGKAIGNNGKVKENICGERMAALTLLLSEKIDNLASDIREIKDVVQSRFKN